jgi:hypothetical protein
MRATWPGARYRDDTRGAIVDLAACPPAFSDNPARFHLRECECEGGGDQDYVVLVASSDSESAVSFGSGACSV